MGARISKRMVVGVLALAAAGCVPVTPNLQTTPTLTSVGERKPLKVAVVVPEATRAFSAAHEIPGICLGGMITFVPTPYGQQLATTVDDRFRRLFDNVAVLDAGGKRDGYDAIFEIGITDVGFQFGCGISPAQHAEVRGSIRAIDPEGREMWRSPTQQARADVPFAMVFDINPIVGNGISQAIGNLADSWTRELSGLDVAQYAGGGSKAAQTARRMGQRAGRTGTAGFSRGSLKLQFAKASPQPDDIAVVIGNGNYNQFNAGIPDVVPAYADTEAFMQYALEGLGLREGNIIYLRDATGAQMVRVFGSDKEPKGQLHDWVRAGRSRVYVYYAGHGAPAGADGSPYLVPADADAARIELNGYPLATLYKNLAQLPAREVTVVLEACFSGISQAGAVMPRASAIYARPRVAEVPRNLTVIAAGQGDQVASWEEDSSHGLFTKYYLTAMAGEADKRPYGNGDGVVTADELKAYLSDTLTYYARRLYGRDQAAQIVAGGRLMN